MSFRTWSLHHLPLCRFALFAAFGHRLDGVMLGQALPARVHVQAARQEKAVHVFQKGANLRFFFEHRHE